ncbi:MAG: APC family permease [Anaerolineae bacterium]|nr:APC family permease [Anaerolineae bacterium]
MHTLLHLLIGPPLPTQRLAGERLNKIRALAAFSPDALSSIAYANQEIFLGLSVAGAAGLAYSLPIGLAIVGILAAVAISYAQTLPAYPTGGGSYAVARANLGQGVGLLAAACLLIDYVLTAAVSLTAGVAAIASAFPALWSYRVALSLAFLVLITLANLRGLREAGTLMAIPVYFFLGSYLMMLAVGAVKALLSSPGSFEATAPAATEPLTTWLVLHALAAGCTALTGIEAISNGVPAFRPPEAKNAAQTLVIMALLMGTLFLGSIGLTQYFAVVAEPDETILSALVRRVLGTNVLYVVVQTATLLILVVAANTSFAGFPRLASILAQDGYAPRQLSFLGDRLVFSNGMLLLAGLTGLLIVAFNGDSHALIPLFAVGVFLAFTLSQAGMVVHWLRVRGPAWGLKAAINGIGALATTLTLGVVLISKFVEGAWLVVLLIPLLLLAFHTVKEHYREVARELTLRDAAPEAVATPLRAPRVVLPISGVHRGVIEALRYARSISNRVTAVYVEVNPGDAERIRQQWERWGQGVPLVVVPSPYRSIVGPLLEYLDRLDAESGDGQLASILLPEFVPAKWWQNLLHNQTAWLLKLALLYRRRRFGKVRAIIDIPWHLRQ